MALPCTQCIVTCPLAGDAPSQTQNTKHTPHAWMLPIGMRKTTLNFQGFTVSFWSESTRTMNAKPSLSGERRLTLNLQALLYFTTNAKQSLSGERRLTLNLQAF